MPGHKFVRIESRGGGHGQDVAVARVHDHGRAARFGLGGGQGLFGGALQGQVDGQINIVARLVGGFDVLALAVVEIIDKDRFDARLAAQLLVIDPFHAATALVIGHGEGNLPASGSSRRWT